MPRIQTRLAASQDQPASEYHLFPELFVEAVNRYWLSDDRVVLQVLPGSSLQTRSDWRSLGDRLTAELLLGSTYVGVCFDGNPGLDAQVLRWLSAIRSRVRRSGTADGVVELKWILSPHPTKPGLGNLNTTWTSFQASGDAAWVREIWSQREGDPFHYGCDLILSVYEANIWGANPWERPLTIEAFLATLGSAQGFIIPLGHDDGFLVGLYCGSRIHQTLQSGILA